MDLNKRSRSWLEHELESILQLLPSQAVLQDEYLVLRLTDTELDALHEDILKKLDERSVWTAATSSGRGQYPVILRRNMKHAKEELVRKTRKSNATVYTCSHIILVANGQKPRFVGMQASHRCHEPMCCAIAHLTWEFRYNNLRRNMCIGQEECLCEQQPHCLPMAHKAD